ncbi:MAG: ABC transporter permease [Acidobacteriota bacterium]
MKNMITIFLKEMKEVLRDRRTLILMIVMPLLLFPVIINVTTTFMMKLEKGAEEKILKVSVLLNGNKPGFEQKIRERKDMSIEEEVVENKIKNLITLKKLDFAVVFDKNFDNQVETMEPADVRLYYRSSAEMDISKRRIDKLLKKHGEELLNERFARLDIDKKVINTLNIEMNDIATVKEKFGERAGGLLPYMFVIFCFIGAMYPAIDLGAGEKERGTIETLLVSPASRFQIVMGKFWVVTAAGIISALLSVTGLFVSIKMNTQIPGEILQVILKIIDIKSISVIFSLLFPLSIFFAGLLLSFSLYAHSFKEAQSIITPLNFAIIIPAFIGTLPGIKLDTVTAMIPVLNVSLASKEIISGTIKAGLLIEVYASLIALAGLSLYFCVKWFNRESVIFRAE